MITSMYTRSSSFSVKSVIRALKASPSFMGSRSLYRQRLVFQYSPFRPPSNQTLTHPSQVYVRTPIHSHQCGGSSVIQHFNECAHSSKMSPLVFLVFPIQYGFLAIKSPVMTRC